MAKLNKPISENLIFALDIGTRSIIGMVGTVENDKLKVLAVEKEEHTKRAMMDGQIEDIDQVARLAQIIKTRLENTLKCKLTRVCVAAAGRALKTQKATYEMELPEVRKIDQEIISRLEAGAIGEAEIAFNDTMEHDSQRQFYLVGYSVLQYTLDNYNMSSLKDHNGKKLKAEVMATFLPSEVVESLYTTMHKIDLEVASLTLEPIAAINAAIPQELRLLNLVLVDIGAGTSDIAACRDGSIIGYTMATIAGDEITETLMREYLVDFTTAEQIKADLESKDQIVFTDVLGLEQSVTKEEVNACILPAFQSLSKEIAECVLNLNNGAPSAVFLAGGGSKLSGLKDAVAKQLQMDTKRVAIAGNNFRINAFSDDFEINNPEYATPLGIAISAGLNLINDSFRVNLNGQPAKLFRSGTLTVLDILMMNGYGYQNLISHSGQNLIVSFNGKRKIIYGERATPAVLMLNGEEARVSDIVMAGDSIEFFPAIHGRPARAALSDLVNLDTHTVLLNGQAVTGNPVLKSGDIILTQRNIDAPEEDELFEHLDDASDLEAFALSDNQKDSGSVETLLTGSADPADHPVSEEPCKAPETPVSPGGVSTAEPAAAAVSVSQTVFTAAPVEKTTTLQVEAPADTVSENSPPAADMEPASSVKPTPSIQSTASQDVSAPAVNMVPVSSTAPAAPVQSIQSTPAKPDTPPESPKEPAPQQSTVPTTPVAQPMVASRQPSAAETAPVEHHKPFKPSSMLYFTLNEKTLRLPAKANGNPYYLMDLLEYSDLDFDNITSHVIMTVNGTDAPFLQELRSGDVIVIACEA